ncbi:MAG: 2-hydroxyglutaryl-CoA dehydratase [Firmicutes bacterium]|nr:2-hydroxyglutaryl-CoA dehydratase [Bacillota bacterium]
MPVSIGIPRTLAYYAFYPWWKTFFQEIGLEVVTSAQTSKATLDDGVEQAVNDACIPIKIFHGHVVDLKDRVDYIFIPRLVSVRKLETETFCPKFLGLPDLVRASMEGLPKMIDVRIDMAKGRLELFRICLDLGRRFGAGFWKTARAFWKSKRAMMDYDRLIQTGLNPVEALESWENSLHLVAEDNNKELTFAVLGYPYAVYDRFINIDLHKKLKSLGVKIITAEMIPPRKLLREAKKMPKNLFWHFSNKVIHATSYFIKQVKVDGIIHITAFGCGPDAMVDKMIELTAKHEGRIPFISLTIDEHTGEGGILTRLEAFVDMLKRQKGLA